MSSWDLYVGGLTADVWQYHPRPERDTTIPARGIEHFSLDETDGDIVHIATAGGDLASPQCLVAHPRLPVVYAAEFADPARLVAFRRGGGGLLERLGEVITGGSLAITAAIHPHYAKAYVGHLGDGTLTTVTIDADGRPEGPEVARTLRSTGGKIHHVAITPDGRTLVVTDFGRDEVASYSLDETGGITAEDPVVVSFHEGCAPRQVTSHPAGSRAYVVGVGDGNLYVLQAANHVPQRVLAVHEIDSSKTDIKPAETMLNANGRMLFVGVRGSNSVVAFTLDETGDVESAASVPSLGESPRSLAIDPSGTRLLVANWHSNRLVVLEGADRGVLRPTGNDLEIRSPGSLLFLPSVPGRSPA